MENKQTKAIAWVRCSTDKQHTTGEQLKEIEMLAAKDGYKKEDLIVIGREGASAIKVDAAYKKDLDTMYEYMNKGEIAVIYAWAVDRIGRDLRENTFFKYKLISCKVALKTVEGVSFQDGDDGLTSIILDLKQRWAEDEMKKKMERFRIGKARCKALGKRTCAAITYGYTVDKENILIVDEERAEDVRTLFRLYATGDYSFLTLSKEMTFRGWKLTPPSVSRVLNNGAYIGKDPHGIKYPRIIDNETWDMCRAVAERKSTRIGLGHKRHWLAAKLIECSDCGCHFTVYGRIEYPSYTCPFNSHKKTFGDKCNNNTRFPSLNFDNLLFGVIVEQEMKRRNVNKEEVAEKLIKEIDDATEKIESIEGELNAAIGAKLDRLEERYIDGAITKQKLERLRQHVLDEQSDLQSELYRLRELKTVKQQQWSDLMGDSVMGNVIDFETWLDSETISKISHDLIKNIKAFRNEDGYVDLSIYCFSGDVYNYQYRPTHGFGGKNWFRRENNGDYTLLKNPKCERNDKNDTVLYHRTTIWE